MRIATWNVEWFEGLYDAEGHLCADDERSVRYGISRRRQAEAIAVVLQALDADAILIVEAPDDLPGRPTADLLEDFAARAGIRARQVAFGFANDTQQELALLFDPDRLKARHDPRGNPMPPLSALTLDDREPPRFDGQYRIDLDIDATLDTVNFSKPPLELEVIPLSPEGTPRAKDAPAPLKSLRMIGVHVKSKAPHGARDPDQARRLAIQNRRKQLAQCIWLRERIERHLEACDDLIVLGDFNDGPGLDEYEALFGRSGLEIVLGQGQAPQMRLHDPHARTRTAHPTAAAPASARFWLDPEKQYFSAMLDYILISPSLLLRRPKWRIWHPFDDPQIYAHEQLRMALLDASDHFPVTLDIEI